MYGREINQLTSIFEVELTGSLINWVCSFIYLPNLSGSSVSSIVVSTGDIEINEVESLPLWSLQSSGKIQTINT